MDRLDRPRRPRYPSQGPGTASRPRYPCPKAPASVSQGPPASVTSQNREEGGTCARTRETASRAAGRASSQAMEPRSGAGDRICREAGTRGAWGDRPGSCSRGSWRTGSSGTIGVRRTRCSVGGAGLREVRGGGCQGLVKTREGASERAVRRRQPRRRAGRYHVAVAASQGQGPVPDATTMVTATVGRTQVPGGGSTGGRFRTPWYFVRMLRSRPNNSEHSVFCVGFPENVLMRCWVAA